MSYRPVIQWLLHSFLMAILLIKLIQTHQNCFVELFEADIVLS